MKYHLLRYLREYREKSFRDVPFSEVDALLLSQLSYLKFDGLVPGLGSRRFVGWEELRNHPQFEKLFDDRIYGETYRKIFELLYGSRRYGQLRFRYYVNLLDEKKESQFAAVTISLGDTSIFVSYRGTDETLVGWKEDFNMSFMKSVPSQTKAVSYLRFVARHTEGRMILGGHSKGGNVAVYAAACVPGEVQCRIRRIYSFDGPGFQKEFYDRAGFQTVSSRVCKIIPEDSWIGMLMTNNPHYRVVRSYGKGIIQHDLLRWKIRDGRFVYREEVYHRSSRRMYALNGWIESLSREQISATVDAMYRIFVTARVSTVYDLLGKPLHVCWRLLYAFGELDVRARKLVVALIGKVLRYL